jgi:hypothetical protein
MVERLFSTTGTTCGGNRSRRGTSGFRTQY